MRVDELSKELGISEADLLSALTDLSADPPQAGDHELNPELEKLVRERLSPAAPLDPDIREAGLELIRRAFDVARLAKKPDWDRMSSAVLKNRMLDLSERSFSEEQFGVDSFRQWLELFGDVIEVDATRRPPWVRLVDPQAVLDDKRPTGDFSARIARSRALPHRWRIRNDLWRAVLDIGAFGDWYWDGDQAVFRPGAPAGDDTPALPSLSAVELRETREAFSQSLQPAERETESIERWLAEMLPDAVLPHFLRGQWVASLKQAVLRRLAAWFDENGIPEPTDLVYDVARSRVESDPADELRGLVLRCVERMTKSELEELRLPPAALVRAVRGR